MRAHSFVPVESRARRVVPGHGILQLGWTHFWLLVATLGGMLALIALALLVAYLPN